MLDCHVCRWSCTWFSFYLLLPESFLVLLLYIYLIILLFPYVGVSEAYARGRLCAYIA